MRESSLTPYLVISFSVHFFGALILFGVAKYGFLSLISVPGGKITMTMVESAVRVDVVSMPKMTLKELRVLEDPSLEQVASMDDGQKTTASTDSRIQEAEDDDSIVYHKKKKKLDFNSLLKKYSRKEVQKIRESGSKSEGPKTQKISGELQKLLNEGNELAKGTRLTGTTTGNAVEFNAYLGALPDVVRPYWKLPSYLMNKNLRCRIRIYLRSDGSLIKASIFESSGVDEYDQRALEAVTKTNPYPLVPADVRARALRGDILLGFPL